MQYMRFVMSVSFPDNTMDAQGRILIPTKLRNAIGLTKDIVFVGVNNYIEIWNADAYSTYDKAIENNFDAVADYVFEHYSDSKN